MRAPTLGNLDLQRQLQRFLGLRGSSQLRLSSDIITVANAFNLDDPPFHSKSGCVGRTSVTAAAAQYPRCRFAYPSSNAGIAVIRYFDAYRYSGEQITSYIIRKGVESALTSGGTGLYSWDDGGYNGGGLVASSESAAALPTALENMWEMHHGVGSGVRGVGPIVLRPGSCIDFYGAIAATNLTVSVYADIYPPSS